MTTTRTWKVVFTATSDWLRIAEMQGLQIDWQAEYDLAAIEEMARAVEASDRESSIRSGDDELGASELIEPRECDSALRAGDVVLTSGPGGDVAFLRIAE